jgi:hypothetical protein
LAKYVFFAEMLVGQMPVGQISVGKIPVGQMPIGKTPVAQLSIGQMFVGQMFFGENTWRQERERSFYLILSHKNYRLGWLSFTIQSSLSLPLSRPFSYLPNTFSSICVSRKRREKERVKD